MKLHIRHRVTWGTGWPDVRLGRTVWWVVGDFYTTGDFSSGFTARIARRAIYSFLRRYPPEEAFQYGEALARLVARQHWLARDERVALRRQWFERARLIVVERDGGTYAVPCDRARIWLDPLRFVVPTYRQWVRLAEARPADVRHVLQTFVSLDCAPSGCRLEFARGLRPRTEVAPTWAGGPVNALYLERRRYEEVAAA